MPTAMKDRAPGNSSAGRQARRTRSAVSQAMPAAPPRPSQASVRASASANGAASAMPARSNPRARAWALTARASAARSGAAGPPGAGSGVGALSGGWRGACAARRSLPARAARRGRGPGRSGTRAGPLALIAPGDEALDGLGVERRAEAQNDVRAAGVGERVEVGEVLGADAGGALDRPRVAAELLAPVVEHAVLALPVVDAAEAVPGVGVLGGDAQGDLLALAADEDRDRAAHRRRVVLCPMLLDDRERRRQVVQAGGRRAELVAEVVVLALEPAGADTQDEAAVADVVDRRRHLREQGRVAVAVAGDHAADGGARGRLGQRGQHRVALERGAVRVAVERVEVVPVPDRVDAAGLHAAGGVAELLVGAVLGVELHAHLES